MKKYLKNCKTSWIQCSEWNAITFSLEHFEKLIDEKHPNFRQLPSNERDNIFRKELMDFRESNKCTKNCDSTIHIVSNRTNYLIEQSQ